jgi:putative addiction module component (TIGR02574 family)
MNHSDPRAEYPDLFKLPVDERLQLVEELWDSIAADAAKRPLPDAVITELRERSARYDANPDSAIPWEEVKRQLQED